MSFACKESQFVDADEAFSFIGKTVRSDFSIFDRYRPLDIVSTVGSWWKSPQAFEVNERGKGGMFAFEHFGGNENCPQEIDVPRNEQGWISPVMETMGWIQRDPFSGSW